MAVELNVEERVTLLVEVPEYESVAVVEGDAPMLNVDVELGVIEAVTLVVEVCVAVALPLGELVTLQLAVTLGVGVIEGDLDPVGVWPNAAASHTARSAKRSGEIKCAICASKRKCVNYSEDTRHQRRRITRFARYSSSRAHLLEELLLVRSTLVLWRIISRLVTRSG